jgi:Protein of unknown function (DUF2795)
MGNQEMQQKMEQMMAGMNFPVSKDELMSYAMQHGASNEQVDMMRKLPMDSFNSMDDIKAAMGSMMKTS